MSLPRNSTARSTRPDRRRVGGGWLSLFAMWMIFIGPLVSQSMPMDHHAGMNMSMAMDMPMASGHSHAGQDHHGHGNDGQLHADWEKCGYCSLLFNCPALPQTLSPLSLASAIPSTLTTYPTRQGHALQAVFPGARSRAPPASINV
ncbi:MULTISPECIES: DUF2946 domain-containing protein [unclassified Pseudomonas]|uniref:DUF2946 domain-containing protein n=1 Tax=Pseudomonas TaxID=286 RepID=UPI0016461858|nr:MULTISPECIES: DUF2946 domain-containing protein [unclassified Pseudomonas]MBC3423108.1 DUF2946 domain-containing protein [Pseudomonas sp. RW3S2]MBC3466875.1 DUF2946 domain-containing protein [Pseudomonas sp. RW10S2]QXI43928.1 DUF2946 domain-containing protein [Pseudomonas wayambapalatensis]